MRTSIIRIGNSKGIRIPKTLLKQCHLGEDVEIEPFEDRLVIHSLSRHRTGWEECFRKMTSRKDDTLFDKNSLGSTKWEKTEWKW